MRIHTWATSRPDNNKPRFGLSLCIFHALYRGFGIALRMDLESEDKKGFGASCCSTIYVILIFMFQNRVGIPCVLRTDHGRLVFNFHNRSRELESLRQAAALELDSPIAEFVDSPRTS